METATLAALHLMLVARYRGGDDFDALEGHAARYIRANGIRGHAADAAMRAVADVDGMTSGGDIDRG